MRGRRGSGGISWHTGCSGLVGVGGLIPFWMNVDDDDEMGQGNEMKDWENGGEFESLWQKGVVSFSAWGSGAYHVNQVIPDHHYLYHVIQMSKTRTNVFRIG